MGAIRWLRLYRRVLASAWVGLYAALLVVTGLHQVVVAHAVCEHGAVVHDVHDEGHTPATADDSTTLVALDADAHDDHHAHCSVDVRSEALTVPEPPPAVVEPLADPLQLASHEAERDALRSQCALRLAPKQSPPAVS